jgi:hypothetical protein
MNNKSEKQSNQTDFCTVAQKSDWNDNALWVKEYGPELVKKGCRK